MTVLEEFEKIEKRHNELMKMIEEQETIMNKIMKNWFTLILDYFFFHKFEKAKNKAFEYLEEGEQLLIRLGCIKIES
jgi:hypothetical protein